MTRAAAVLAGALAVALAAGAPAGLAHRSAGMRGHVEMVGDMNEFPDLAAAGHRNVARARRLLRASRRSAPRFDTMAEAERLGYRIDRFMRPGFVHMRKYGARFWGRKFDADAPQAILFWCPSRGACTLAAYMYRAPGGRPPSTWGDLLMWHRHGQTATATWMTHVWLLRSLRRAYATCAPADALEHDLKIRLEPYPWAVATHRCKSENAPDDMPMPAM